MNSIILLFISDIDEKLYKLVKVVRPSWVKKLEKDHDDQATDIVSAPHQSGKRDDAVLEEEVEKLKKEVAMLRDLVISQAKVAGKAATLSQDANFPQDAMPDSASRDSSGSEQCANEPDGSTASPQDQLRLESRRRMERSSSGFWGRHHFS